MEKGKGWHLESRRHSEAQLYGRASGVRKLKAPSLRMKGQIEKDYNSVSKPEYRTYKYNKPLSEDDFNLNAQAGLFNRSALRENKTPLSQEEKERLNFSKEAERGVEKYSMLSSKKMIEMQEKYESSKNKNPRNPVNKQDFYEFVDENTEALTTMKRKAEDDAFIKRMEEKEKLEKQTYMQKEGEIKVDKKVSPSDYAGFTGTENYYKEYMGINVTDGIKDFQMRAETNWLITDIAVNVKMHPKVRGQDFVTIKAKQLNDKAIVTYEDGNGNKLYSQKYEYADLPKGDWKFFYRDNVLMFPSEY